MDERETHRADSRRAGWTALVAAALTLGLIAYGAWVRVSGSGLGCGDAGGVLEWPLCEGALVPALEGATGVEFGHRVYAGAVMLTTAAAWLFAFRARRSDPASARLLAGALAAILAQAALGGLTVLTELHGMVRLAHLTFSLLTLSLLTGGAIKALDVRLAAPPGVRRWRALGVAAAFVVLAGGAIVGTGQSAGCPGLPLCDARSSAEAAGIHSVHRVAATALVLAFLWTPWRERRLGGAAFAMSIAVAVIALAQFAVGVSAVWLRLPEELRVLHLGLAAAMWWGVSAQATFALIGRNPR